MDVVVVRLVERRVVQFRRGTSLLAGPKFQREGVGGEGGVGSVQSLDRLGRRGNMMDDSAEILSQPFVQEGLLSSSGTGRDVHSLMLSIRHFLFQPRRHSPSKVP